MASKGEQVKITIETATNGYIVTAPGMLSGPVTWLYGYEKHPDDKETNHANDHKALRAAMRRATVLVGNIGNPYKADSELELP